MSEALQPYYYGIVFIGMLYAFYKAGISKTSFIIILIFWAGLFQYLGNITESEVDNFYKILVVVLAFAFSWKKIFQIKTKYDYRINLIFILFSISFWITYSLYGGNIITILSQYLFKYGLVFIIYHYFKDIEFNVYRGKYVGSVILTVLFIQVFLSIIKVLFIGINTNIGIYEPIVGSISAGGAGTAVVVPVMALIFYWVFKNRKFDRKDWFVAISFIIIAFASAKRQPIVFFPLILYLLFSYVQKGINIFNMAKYLPIVILLFVVGVKLNPSFNPDNKVWGRFDINYVTDYAFRYYFGVSEPSEVFSESYDYSYGRGGGLIYYFQPHKLNLHSFEELVFGKGRYEVATSAHGRFTRTATAGYGIQHGGLMGEAGAMLYSFGYLGTLLMVLLAITIIGKLNDKRLAVIIIFYYLWDFLFYYNQVIFSNQSAIIVLFIVFYTNSQNYITKSNTMHAKPIP